MASAEPITATDLKRSLPDLSGTVKLQGLTGAVQVYRDEYGIPHIKAANQADAFFAQGFATAQDRRWQMEFDRRRGVGRWAEVAGQSALEQDRLMRRFRLEHSARQDFRATSDMGQAMLEAYARGVNAFVDSTATLPIEFTLTGITPEPWQPWDGLIVYKVRHLFMGVFESKVWRARMVRQLGPEKTAALFPGYQAGDLLILPPGTRYIGPWKGALDDALEELSKGVSALNYLKETDSGSNSWVLAGNRTASGKPILAGDSHRALDTPNVYYQNQVSCPQFDVVGLSFAGLPGFPHFGHNQWVSWSVTHTGADYQDLYIEKFNPDGSGDYLYQDQWRQSEIHQETIKVRDGDDVDFQAWVTRHGPVISGDPAKGVAVSFRYTATDGPDPWPDILHRMLLTKNCAELMDSMQGWVDPVNNLLAADVHGNIGYLCRGEIPIRAKKNAGGKPQQNALLPAPGWTGEHEWEGQIPFGELPRCLNPPEGYIATANNKPVDDNYPHYIGTDFYPAYRVERVTKALLGMELPISENMAIVHQERLSIPAQSYIRLLQKVKPTGELATKAWEKLVAWSGRMDGDAVEPTIYSALRDSMLRRMLQHNLGEELTELAWDPADRGRGVFLMRFKALLVSMISDNDCSMLPPGEDWISMMDWALTDGVARLTDLLGPDIESWAWEKMHQVRPAHTLSGVYPELAALLDPPPIPMSGDADTPLAGSYSPADFANVGSLSVARYSYDLSDWNNCLWSVPLGSSGHPASKHYHDQAEIWRQVKMVPMHYTWDHITTHSETHQMLKPK